MKDDLVIPLLNSTGVLHEGQPLGFALQQAFEQLQALKRKAEEALSKSPLVPVVAKGKVLEVDGGICLVSRTKLPTMGELRERAKRLGVDISRFGKRRSVIQQHLLSTERARPMSGGPDETKVSDLPEIPIRLAKR